MVVDPVNRLSYATIRMKEAKQKKDQSVRDFVKYIEELEKDIPAWDLQRKEAWDLLNGLRPEIRIEVLRENKDITSRAQVIAAAQRQEELNAQQAREKRNQPTERAHTQPHHQKDKERKQETRQRPTYAIPVVRADKDECHNCGKKGHWAKDCRSPKRNRVGTGAAQGGHPPKN